VGSGWRMIKGKQPKAIKAEEINTMKACAVNETFSRMRQFSLSHSNHALKADELQCLFLTFCLQLAAERQR
jgi:hypothetical protein